MVKIICRQPDQYFVACWIPFLIIGIVLTFVYDICCDKKNRRRVNYFAEQFVRDFSIKR